MWAKGKRVWLKASRVEDTALNSNWFLLLFPPSLLKMDISVVGYRPFWEPQLCSSVTGFVVVLSHN